eukprot:1153806-Pelagomonas_calceolata.AAC.11
MEQKAWGTVKAAMCKIMGEGACQGAVKRGAFCEYALCGRGWLHEPVVLRHNAPKWLQVCILLSWHTCRPCVRAINGTYCVSSRLHQTGPAQP